MVFPAGKLAYLPEKIKAGCIPEKQEADYLLIHLRQFAGRGLYAKARKKPDDHTRLFSSGVDLLFLSCGSVLAHGSRKRFELIVLGMELLLTSSFVKSSATLRALLCASLRHLLSIFRRSVGVMSSPRVLPNRNEPLLSLRFSLLECMPPIRLVGW